MIDYKIIFGVIAVGISFVAYIPYVRDIFLGKTKPHAFSWLVWSIILVVGFAAQVVKGAGPGAWFTGFEVLTCSFIFILAIARGTRTFPFVDWLALFTALLSIYAWWLTRTPTVAVIFVALADAIAFSPTFRKGFFHPREETMVSYALFSVAALCSIAALKTYNIATVLYPASLAITQMSFALMIIFHRRQDMQRAARVP